MKATHGKTERDLKKRILYISTHPHLNLAAPSGPGTHIREVVAAFRAMGHEVQTFIAGGEELTVPLQSISFKKSKWKKWIPKLIWNTLKELSLLRHNHRMKSLLRKKIETFSPDFIYERSYYLMTAAVEVAKEKNIEIFCEINAPYPEEVKHMGGGGLLHFLSHSAETKQSQWASKIVVVSSAMRDYFIRRTGVTGSKIIVTPNAVRNDFHRVDEKAVATLMQEYSLTGCTVFGFVGSIFPYHGVDRLLDAFADLPEKENCRLLIVGDGEMLPELKQRAMLLAIDHLVVFTGNVAPIQVPKFIACMDVTVMAWSNWYGSPVKIFEYGALGKYIIAPDKGPVRDVMVHGIDGYVCNGSIEDLRKGMITFIQEPGKCQEMATHFMKKVQAQHTWEKVTEQITEGWE